MKITKSYLKQIIKEEMQKLHEYGPEGKAALLRDANQDELGKTADVIKLYLTKDPATKDAKTNQDFYNQAFSTFNDYIFLSDGVYPSRQESGKLGSMFSKAKQMFDQADKQETKKQIITLIDQITQTIMRDPKVFKQK